MKFILPDSARTRHIYMAGKTQSGKSTLIHWMALQDIRQGKGVCVIDPHGDLVKRLVHYIPESRVPDTIFFDASTPIPIDFMGYENERERDTLADDILVTFMRFSQTWGERMDAILRHTIYSLLEARRCTFLDIYYFLASEGHRKRILDRVKNRDLYLYWKDQFPLLPKDAATPITSRMSKFLLTPSLRTILGSTEPKLNIFEVMEQKKILLVNLSSVGQESGNLLGTLLVSKIQQAAMRRQYQAKEERIPFYLYVDEFQHFQTSAFDVILSEAGKYKLCLTLAHQYIDQLDPKIKASILGNVSTLILFRLNEKDARAFKGEIDPYEPQHLLTLRRGRALYRAASGKATIINTPAPPTTSNASYAEIIRKSTGEKYACDTQTEMLELKDDDDIKPTGRPKRVSSHKG